MLSRSTKKQSNQSFRPDYCNMRTRSALLVRSSESRDRHKIVKIRFQKKGLGSVFRRQMRKRRSLGTIWCLWSPSITGKTTNLFLPSPTSHSSLQFLLSTFNPCFHPLLSPHSSSALTKEFFEHFEQQFFSKWLQNPYPENHKKLWNISWSPLSFLPYSQRRKGLETNLLLT